MENARIMAPLRKNDPYYDEKVYHFAAKFSRAGGASALCYKKPRVIPFMLIRLTHTNAETY